MKLIFKYCFFLLFSFFLKNSYAQFAPAVGQAGSTAIYKDSSVFIDWANSSKLVRGYQNISSTGSGFASTGDSLSALGIAGTNGVVSLGDAGYAILQFNKPLVDGQGADLAIFENGFDNTFLELAFVEVSSDGINYFRFPATSNTDTTTQTGTFGLTDATKINNLAGKYKGLYGTPFDLVDIPNNILLSKQAITHVKITDVVGSMQTAYCTRDINNHKINDPWPTTFASSGFDLDAVGVIHNQQSVGITYFTETLINLFPNPAKQYITIASNRSNLSVCVLSLLGKELLKKENINFNTHIDISTLHAGIYIVIINLPNNTQRTIKLIKED